jgi:AraC family transcriptional regulator
MEPRIVRRPALHLVGMRGRFARDTTSQIPALSQIPELWGRFAPRMAGIAGRRDRETSYGVCAAGKDERGVDALEYTAAVEVEALTPPPADMVSMTLPAATYAVFTHTGPIAGIGATWDAIHDRWLPAAGLTKTDAPDFETYDERWDPATGTGPVDIYVPIRPPS